MGILKRRDHSRPLSGLLSGPGEIKLLSLIKFAPRDDERKNFNPKRK